MEYVYPHKGYHTVNDQFLLGDSILVAPVWKQGERERCVVLPEGKWLYLEKEEYTGGGTVTVPAPIDTLPYFVKG